MKKLIVLIILIGLWIQQVNAVVTTDEQIEMMRETSSPRPHLVNASDIQSQVLDYAFSVSNDFTWFVLTLFAESGLRPDAVGDNGSAHWVCQWNSNFGWSWLINDKNFTDYKYQVDECYKSYVIWSERGVIANRLHWYKVRLKYIDRFSR